MAELVAVQSGLALFRSGEVGVIIDTNDLNPYDPQPLSAILAAGEWAMVADSDVLASPEVCYELADAALEGYETDIELAESPNDARVVRVPKKVQSAVRAGLDALRGDETSAVPLVAAGTAEKLLSGNISIGHVRRIQARFADPNISQSIRMIYGGDAGRDWAAKVCGITAAIPPQAPPADSHDVDVLPPPGNGDWTDPNEPHEFLVIDPDALNCALCGRPAADPIHVAQNAGEEDFSDDSASIEADEDSSGMLYFASFAPDGDMGPTFKVDHIYAKDQDGGWWIREFGEWSPTQAPTDADDVVLLDLESYAAAAEQLDEPGTAYAELSISEERLFELAEPHLDFETLDAVFAAAPYVPTAVRSANAKKQLRDTKGQFIEAGGTVHDANGDRGTIVGMDHESGTVQVKIADGSVKSVPANEVTVDGNAAPAVLPEPATNPLAGPAGPRPPVARLANPPKLVSDIKQLIDDYLENSQKLQAQAPATAAGAHDDPLIPPDDPTPANPSPTSSGPPLNEAADASGNGDPVEDSPVPPLYLAEVDPQDTSAVLACLAVIPAAEQGANITVYKRVADGWQLDNDARQAIQGPTPPALVQLTPDMLQNVENQIGEGGQADGSGQAEETSAIAAAGYAIMQRFELGQTGLTASQVQGARLLTPYGTPDTWPTDVVGRLNEFIAGVEATPGDVKSTERLRQYWVHGEGAAKIRWGEPNDWYRCVEHLSKYLGNRAKGYCTLRHHDALGKWPGQEDPGHGHGRGVRGAGALVGEVQDLDPELDGPVEGLGDDIDLPHPFDPGEDGVCATCERDLDHVLHVVVLVVPSVDDDDEADAEPNSPAYDADVQADDGDPFNDDEDEYSSFRNVSTAERKKASQRGQAMPDGSYPIISSQDLKNAIKAYGRAKNPQAVKRHIIKRARALGKTKLLPPDWKVTGAIDVAPEDVDYAQPHEFQPTVEASLTAAMFDECECGRDWVDAMHTDVEVLETLLADALQEVDAGQRFRIPLVVPEGVESGDGRTFASDSLSSRPMPLALMWQPEGDEGHNGSVIVGRVDHVERIENGLGNAYGVFDTGEWGQEALRLVRAGMLRGISADLDEFSANVMGGGENENHVTATKLMVTSGRLMGVTLVAKPAYAECVIELIDGEGDSDVPDGQYSQDRGDARVAALIASAAPLNPPASWFENPNLTRPTHLTVDDEGRVFGHIAAWDVDHIGLPFGTRAPKSVSNYAYFRTGSIKTAEGTNVKVGQLTLTGGHAPLKASARDAVKHYDDTASAVADLAAGEDNFGIWVSGALRPGVTPEQVRALRASSPSGDWRPIRGALELVAVCQVNVPGFPVAEVMVAGGQVMALVAAGALTLETAKTAPQADIDARIAALEAAEQKRLDAQASAIRSRMATPLEERNAALTAAALAAKERIDAVRNAKREALLAAAEALKNRAHPERAELLARREELKARIAAGGLEVVPFEEDKHPRDRKGRFREVLARLEHLLKDDPEAQEGVARLEDAASKEDDGDHEGAAAAAHDGAEVLEKAAHAAEGAVKAKLDQAAKEVRKAADDHSTGGTGDSAIERAGEVFFDELTEEVKEMLDDAVTRAEQQLDPANPQELFDKIKAFITGTNPMNPRDVYKFIKNQLKREVRPHATPTVSGPSPTNPGGGGVQGPGVGNGPMPS